MTAARTLLVTNARVLTWDAARTDHARADIVIADGRIAAIGRDLARTTRADRVLDATGLVAIPGLINAHVHSPGNLMRGTLEGLPLELFMLYEVPPLAAAAADPRLAYLRTAIGAIEMLKLGITSVIDDAFFVPLADAGTIDAVLGAYRDSGMRATVSLDQPIVVEYEKYPFLADILPAEMKRAMERAPRETIETMREAYAHLIDTWHGAAGGRLAAAVSCSAPQRATVPYLEWLADVSAAKDLPFICHILETKTQRVLGEEKFGRSLVRYAADVGILTARMQVIHAIWIDYADIATLARSGCTVAHNPVCNLRLGSGIMPFRRLRAAGVPICLGTDEAVSDDSHNVWIAAKTAATMHTITEPDDRLWPTTAEILDAVWQGGARALRRPGVTGRIEVGAAADIALLDLDADAFTPLNDLPRQLVLCQTGADVRHTIVAGEVVVENGRVTTLDEAAIKAEVRALAPMLAQAIADLRIEAARLEPFYRQMYQRCAARDVGFTRWAAGA